MQTPRFYYFDLGNVLLKFDHRRACKNIAQLAGVPFDDVWKFVFEGELQTEYETGRLTSEAFHAAFCQTTASNPSLKDLMHAASDMFDPIEPMIELAAAIGKTTDQIGILSNTCPAHWEFVIEKFPQLPEIFPVVALSYEMKCMKPAEDIYTQAATLAGHQPADIFFVDDRPENVQGAISAGFDAVQYTAFGSFLRDLQQRSVIA